MRLESRVAIRTNPHFPFSLETLSFFQSVFRARLFLKIIASSSHFVVNQMASPPAEFFDAQEDIVDEGEFGREQRSRSISQERNEQSSAERSLPPQPANPLPSMQLLPPPTDKLYPTIDALIEDVNKTASRQGYTVVKNGGNRNDKDGLLRKVRLVCSKGGVHNESRKKAANGQRNRTSQRTDCPWKAYACRSDYTWHLRVQEDEHNHPASPPEAFAVNRQFTPADLAIIKDDYKAHIPPATTLARLRNLNPGKNFLMRDLHNQRAKIRRQESARATPIQNLLQELQALDLWFIDHQLDEHGQLKQLFFAFEPSLELLKTYPDVLFIDYTYKTNKYNMPLCIFNGVSASNRSFYIGFAFLRHEDKDSHHWILSRVRELFKCVGKEEGPKVILTDKEDALIAGLEEVMPANYHILCVWHINKNILARATKFFPRPEEIQAWMDLWYKVCQAPTLAEYEQARVELRIADPARIRDHQESLFEYVDREYLANGTREKHCHYWTNRIAHLIKRIGPTVQGGHANIKKGLERTLGDLPTMARVIKEQIKDQLGKDQSPGLPLRPRGRPQNPQREPPAFEIAQAPLRGVAKGNAGEARWGGGGGGGGGDEDGDGGRNGLRMAGGVQQVRGGGGNAGRGEYGVGNSSRGSQTQRIGLRRSGRFQEEDISGEDFFVMR